MRLHHNLNLPRSWIASVIVLILCTSSSAPLPAQTPQTPPRKAAPQATPTRTAAAAQAVDGGWPRAYKTPSGGSILLYAPQVSSWENQQHMTAYAAVSYISKGASKAALGTVKLEADTKVSIEERLVSFASLKITESNFSTLSKEQANEVVSEIINAIPKEDRVIALDRVLANIDTSQIIPKQVEGIKSDPPKIFFSKKPAILVNFDGEPIWSPIKENDLMFAINTNWDVFQHDPTKTYYLRNKETWLKASNVKGPWAPAGKLPESFNKLPADENFKDVKSNLPGKKLSDKAPMVFVNFEPSELILLNGEPKYVLVPDTQLLWVSNTESDLFRMWLGGPVYYLVTGRWFSAPDFTGPWTFATTNLPEDFKKISLEHPRSRVLASVPGTRQAAEAVLLAQIPQTARVNKKQVQAPEVVYQGDPQFQAIEKTSVKRAVNTDKDIIKVGDIYYMCFQGVWFMAKSPKGPWEVTGSVPGQIYEIPASSPAHNVTYVTVEEENNDSEWVTVAAMAGYTGMMIAWGCTVWGTGWYYPPYVWYGGYYPIYYPYYHTYGAAAWYNPYNGAYGAAGGIYGPYGGVTYGARYNPSTGAYARGAAAYGPYGSRGYAEAYNPRTGAYAQTRQGSNVYGSWGSTNVQRGDDWAHTKRYSNRQTGETTRVTRTAEGGMVSRRGPEGGGFVGSSGNNLYAGQDGNVYKRGDGGNWQKFDNGNWKPVDKPQRQGATPGQQPRQAGISSDDPMFRKDATPTQRAGVPDNDPMFRKDANRAQERSAQSRDRAGQSVPTPGQYGGQSRQIDRSTYSQLEYDRSARTSGAKRTSDYGDYRTSGSSNRSVGSYSSGSSRGGGGYRGGGGFRGGGRGR
jgi:hypothetical protein